MGWTYKMQGDMINTKHKILAGKPEETTCKEYS
jgi:hypothetical protein